MLLKELLRKHTPGLFAKLHALNLVRLYAAEANPLVYNCRHYTSSDKVRSFMKILATPFNMLGYLFSRDIPASEREGLAFVLIAKNEAPYIEEWINFHVKQGVTHFIIYDNESTDNFREVLEPYIKSGLVTYKLLKGRRRQIDAYNMALHDYKHKFRYMAFIDADEFVFVRNNTDRGGLYSFVDDFMKSHPNAGGLGVNWLSFGSSGHKTKPEGGVIENYTKCAEKNFDTNYLIKTICDPVKVISLKHSVHKPEYYYGFYNLDENGEIIEHSTTREIHFDKIRINHYFTKSKEEYIQKMTRGKADKNDIRSMEEFYSRDRNECEDTEILSHV